MSLCIHVSHCPPPWLSMLAQKQTLWRERPEVTEPCHSPSLATKWAMLFLQGVRRDWTCPQPLSRAEEGKVEPQHDGPAPRSSNLSALLGLGWRSPLKFPGLRITNLSWCLHHVWKLQTHTGGRAQSLLLMSQPFPNSRRAFSPPVGWQMLFSVTQRPFTCSG